MITSQQSQIEDAVPGRCAVIDLHTHSGVGQQPGKLLGMPVTTGMKESTLVPLIVPGLLARSSEPFPRGRRWKAPDGVGGERATQEPSFQSQEPGPLAKPGTMRFRKVSALHSSSKIGSE